MFRCLLGIVSLAVSLSACSPTLDTHGYNPEDLDIKKIAIGQDTQDTILEKFGTPTLTSVFPDQNHGTFWYYTFKKTSTTAFYKPETLEQRTVVIHFNRQGIVTCVEDEQGERAFNLCEQETPIRSYKPGIMRDIFGNFGRYGIKQAEKK
jgi:outer membrane protein assembly factor BamE (lipoprotein component of BamABCDE complex)